VVLPVAAIGVLAATQLPTPFCGDTAMFFTAARALDAGGVLYLDFWDFKQPGIYWFFLLAGRLFGFSQLGVRIFEALWQLSLAALMIASLSRYYDHRWLAAIAPLAAIGTYFAVATDWELSQLEALVALPTFACAWLLTRTPKSTSASAAVYFAAGLCAAATVVFKLALAPIFVGFVLLAAVHGVAGWPLRVLMRRLLAIGLPFAVGVALVLAAVTAVYAWHGGLPQFLWSTFVFPVEALRYGQMAPISRLPSGPLWYAGALSPFIVLAGVVLPRTLRGEEPLLTKVMLAWIVLGLLAILLQRFSWWRYHFLLLFVPTAVLGVRGIDLLVRQWSLGERGVRQAMAATMLLTALTLGAVTFGGADHLLRVSKAFGSQPLTLEEYRRLLSRDYERIADEVEIIRSDDDARPIYVFGNPLFHLLSGRPQAIPVNGWGWQFGTPEQWQALPEELARGAPSWVFVDKLYEPLLNEKSPQTLGYLQRDFVVERQDALGTLYRAREKPPGNAPATG
jgi:hypothetical protein